MTLSVNDLTDAGAPKVELLLTGLSPDVASVTGFRLANGAESQVSGIVNASVAGAGSWVDYEVPAQQATYRFLLKDDFGVPIGYTESVTVELGFTGCWMHNPFAPSGAVRVRLLDTAGKSISRPVPGDVVWPAGRRVGVVVSQPRRGLSNGVFDVYAEDLNTADRIQAFLGSESVSLPPVICIRMGIDHAGFRVSSPLFLSVFDIAEEDLDLRAGGSSTIQRIVGDEVARPAPGYFIPLLRRMDVNAYYASRADFDAAYLSRLDANRDYSLAGFAD